MAEWRAAMGKNHKLSLGLINEVVNQFIESALLLEGSEPCNN